MKVYSCQDPRFRTALWIVAVWVEGHEDGSRWFDYIQF
jgi:hypothetical protein